MSKVKCENSPYFDFMWRTSNAAAGRIGEAKNVEFDLADMLDLARHVEVMTHQAIHAMRAADPEQASWTKIGAAAGISRQAAQQRWGKAAPTCTCVRCERKRTKAVA